MTSSATLTADFSFNLNQRVGTMPGSHRPELLAVTVGAVYFVKTARWIAGAPDNGRACENIVHERSGSGAVEQAGAGIGFHANNHKPVYPNLLGRYQLTSPHIDASRKGHNAL
jgi:hypothetical protein